MLADQAQARRILRRAPENTSRELDPHRPWPTRLTARGHRVGGGQGRRVPPRADSPGTPPTVRGQYTVVEDEVDARARRERGESFQQLHRFEQERRRAAGPLSFQGEQHSAVGGPRHSLLRDRRPENVAGKLFEAVAAVGGDVDVGGWLSPSSRCYTRSPRREMCSLIPRCRVPWCALDAASRPFRSGARRLESQRWRASRGGSGRQR